MADSNTENDDGPADPFETELVAYLDGELDEAAAREVEARLEHDPDARARAAALKRSFDLLDYLPKPEPSPTFTTRTLDKLPSMKTGSAPQAPATRSGPGVGPSTSLPVLLDDEPARPGRGLWRVAALCAAVLLFATAGYFATAAVRPHLFAARDKEPEEARPEAKPEPDASVIENLPLYAVADDLAFVTELARSEYFGDDPAVSFDSGLKIPPGEGDDRPTGKQLDALAKSFRALPAARQAEIVKLDRDLHAKEQKEQDRLFRALEVYAVWLDRLPEAERRGVLTAATPALRLRVVRDLREGQWLDALPPPLRKKADALTNPKERADLIQGWKTEDAGRRDRWAFARRHAEAFAANKSPWPFDTEAGRREVVEFARATFKYDDPNPRRNRLSADERGVLLHTLALGERDGVWAWYGLTVYELSKLHPYLPEPADAKAMWTEEKEIPDAIAKELRKMAGQRLRPVAGRWPEFALELHNELKSVKKLAVMPQVGPANVTEFKDPVRAFWAKELSPKLTGDERAALKKLEGKWPEYPHEFVRLAAKYDLAVPGVTLPGPPKKWDATYGVPAGARPAN